MMFEILAALCLITAVGLLITLAVIDLKTLLLPNIWNLALALWGAAFHVITGFVWLAPIDMVIGAMLGAGFLYVVRVFANAYYKQDALGLGDVKLLGAAGIWLGPDYILIAIIAGALAGIVHGCGLIGYSWLKTREIKDISRFSLPAGPGFCFGIFVAGVAMFAPFVQGFLGFA